MFVCNPVPGPGTPAGAAIFAAAVVEEAEAKVVSFAREIGKKGFTDFLVKAEGEEGKVSFDENK